MSEPEIRIRGRRVTVDLMYPRVDDNPNEVEVGICCVRAADSILVRFDFDRNGYVILQASTFAWKPDDKEMDPDWQEVAFIEAWGREKDPEWLNPTHPPHEGGRDGMAAD